MTRKSPVTFHTYLVKASWNSTAIKFYVDARSEDEAWEQAAKNVKKMLGGMFCEEIKIIGST